MNIPEVVPQAEWRTAREGLLAKEKEATRARDALAAERRRLPMVRIDKDYVFEGPDGEARPSGESPQSSCRPNGVRSRKVQSPG